MRSVPQPPRKLGRDALGAGNFSGGQGGAAGGVTRGAERMVADSLQPSSGRPIPQSSASLPVHSSSTPNTHAIQAFYRTANDPLASNSMHDLSRPGPGPGPGPGRGPPGGEIIPQLKTSRSTPNVGMRRMDSFPNLMSNLDVGAGAPRPQPPSGLNGRQKPRVDPLDVHFARGPAAMPLTHSPMPLTANSPLSRSPLARDQPPMMMGGNDLQPLPKALNIVKAPPSPAIPPRSALRKPPSKPPSPAPSAMASSTASLESDGISVRDLERPFMPAASDSRPPSRGSNRGNIPSTLRELMAVDEFLCDSPTDAVPTPPPSLPRASNDSVTRPSLNEPAEAVVQTVRAKQDMVTISPAKKRSLEKKIKAFDSSLRSEAGVPRSASEHRAERPAPLKVKTVLNHTATLQGPSSAPVVAPRQRSESPYGRTPTPLGRARTGVPAAAVGAQGRPRGPTMQRVRRPTINEYGVTPSRSGTPVMDEAGGAPVRPVIHIEIPERGPSPSSLRSPPDSPILPRQGPLSARSPPDSPILPSHGPLSAVSPSGSPIFPSFGRLSAGSPPSSPILPSRGPLSAGSSPPGSPILPSHGPLSAGSPPDSPIIPSEGPLSNPASPPDSPIMPLSGPLAYSGPAVAKKDDPRRETLDRGFQFPARPVSPEKPEPQPEPAPESLILPPPMSQMAPPGGLEWPLFAPSIPMPESRAGSPALMMRTQSPVLPIARSQSPAAMPARAQSPAFSVRAQSPALPAVRAQSPALPIQRTQSPALPAQRTQSPFAVQLPKSPAVNVQRAQSPFAVQPPQSMQPPQSPFAVPSFSRPRPSTPGKRSELPVPITQQQMRGPSPSPRGPPPRANTDLYGMRNSPKPMMNSRMARDYM